MHAPSPHHLATVALLATIALPAPTRAQDAAQEDTSRRPLLTTLGVVVAPTSTTGWLWLEGWITDRRRVEPELDALRRLVLLQRYLDAHEAATREALAIGHGPALEDLGALLGVRALPTPRTIRALRLHRAPWDAHTTHTLYTALTTAHPSPQATP